MGNIEKEYLIQCYVDQYQTGFNNIYYFKLSSPIIDLVNYMCNVFDRRCFGDYRHKADE